jgi:pantothenate kinase
VAELAGQGGPAGDTVDSAARAATAAAGGPAEGATGGSAGGSLGRSTALAAGYLPMDGFHLANTVLAALGRADRKGAPDTFDADGYVTTLRRVATELDRPVYAPRFHREIEESYAAEIVIGPGIRVVVTEGNYLLVDEPPWREVRTLLDAVWYVTVPESVRLDRLVRRRVGLGQPVAQARTWATGSDQRNADLVGTTRSRADGEVTGL